MKLSHLSAVSAGLLALSTVVCAGTWFFMFGGRQEEHGSWSGFVLGIGFAHSMTIGLAGGVLRERVSSWAAFIAAVFGLVLASVLAFIGFGEYLSRDEHSHFSLFVLAPPLMIVIFATSVIVLLIGATARVVRTRRMRNSPRRED